MFSYSEVVIFKVSSLAGCGGGHFQYQHSGVRGRQVSRFEASMVSIVSSKKTRVTLWDPVSTQNNNKTDNDFSRMTFSLLKVRESRLLVRESRLL